MVTNVLLAGGAVSGGKDFRDAIKLKQDQVITEIGTVDVGT